MSSLIEAQECCPSIDPAHEMGNCLNRKIKGSFTQ
jgi:hypothetical protein